MLRPAIVGLLLLAITTAPVVVSDDDVIASGSLPGPGWVAVRYVADGSTVRVHVVFEDVTAPYGAAYVVYDADGDVVTHSAVLKPKREFGISLAAGPVDQDLTLLTNVTELDAFGPSVSRRGEFVAVVWFAAKASGPATWTVRGGEDAKVLAVDQGPETWILNGADFPQQAGVRVAAGIAETPRAQVGAVHERVLEGRPAWWFFSSVSNGLHSMRAQDVLRAETPDGIFGCGGLNGGACGHFTGGSPGTYRWTADGAGVDSVWLMGAAPRWP